MSFTFITPPNAPFANILTATLTFTTDGLANITWETTLQQYTIDLHQQDNKNSEVVIPLPDAQIFVKEPNEKEVGGFLWDISATNISSEANFFHLSTFSNGVFTNGSNSFSTNDTDSSTSLIAVSQGASSPVDTSIISSSTISLQNSITTSQPSSSTTTSVPISTTPTTTANPKSTAFTASQNSTSSTQSSSSSTILYILAALGSCLLLFIFLFYIRRYFQKRHAKSKNDEAKLQSPSTTPSNQESRIDEPTNAFDAFDTNSPHKAELSTPFNVVRSMKATVLSKFELPGKDNERPSGPYEISE